MSALSVNRNDVYLDKASQRVVAVKEETESGRVYSKYIPFQLEIKHFHTSQPG